MWKIFFEYSDKSKCTVTGKQKDIPLRLAKKYYDLYGRDTVKAEYQQYPKKNHKSMHICEKIMKLEEFEEE